MNRRFDIPEEKDLLGLAILDYVQGRPRDLITWTTVSPPEILRTSYLFRTFEDMPPHERLALSMARGHILDVGAGSGTHSLHLQNRGHRVTALEISPRACEAMDLRGVRDIRRADFFTFDPGVRYDTVLLLMNGAGIMGTLDRAEDFFLRLHSLLAPDGQVLLHTSDISYVYYAYDIPLPLHRYYGEVEFRIKYGDICGEPFPWLYFDEHTLGRLAALYGFDSQILRYDEAGDTLIRLTKR